LSIYDEVLEFIKRRWSSTDANWLNGNCYYFSLILCHRFPQLKKYYLPVDGHFIAGDGKVFFDWTGLVVLGTDIALDLDYIEKTDKIWYNRIIRDCVN